MAFEKKIFTGGLDSDTEDRYLAQNDYRDALNIRNSEAEQAAMGAIENVLGNTLAGDGNVGGSSKTIGAENDKINNKIYYCVWAFTSSEHSVLEFDITAGTTTTVLKHANLNFGQFDEVIDMDVIDGSLYFNDKGRNQPRKLNIERAKNTTVVLTNNLLGLIGGGGITASTTVGFEGKLTFTSLVGVGGLTSVDDVIFVAQDATLDTFIREYNGLATVLDVVTFGSFPFIQQTIIINKEFNVAYGNGAGGKTYKDVTVSDDIYDLSIPEYEISFAKPAPNCNPTATFIDTGDGETNALRQRLFQFATKYFYKDSEESSQSAYSKIPLPPGEAAYETLINYPTGINNAINITIDTGSTDVKSIRVLGRIAALDEEGSPGTWFIIKDVNKETENLDDNQKHTLEFRNDRSYVTADNTANGLRLYDFVPTKANSLAFIEGARATFGGITEDRDPVIALGEVEVIYQPQVINSTPEVTLDSSNTTEINVPPFSDFNDPPPTDADHVLDVGSNVTLGDRYNIVLVVKAGTTRVRRIPELDFRRLHINVTTLSFKIEFTVIAESGDTPAIIADKIQGSLGNVGYLNSGLDAAASGDLNIITGVTSTGYINANSAILSLSPNAGSAYDWVAYSLAASSYTANGAGKTSEKSMKAGARHDFGLVYYDNFNRSGLTQFVEGYSVYVDWYSDRGLGANGKANPRMNIAHDPPSWANFVQVVYTGQLSILRIPLVQRPSYLGFIQGKVLSGDITVNAETTELVLNCFTNWNDNQKEFLGLGYDFTKGDRIRWITQDNDPSNQFVYLTDYQDSEIIAFDSGTQTITFKNALDFTPAAEFEFEIYSPEQTAVEKLFFEVGECQPVHDGKHRGNIQNQGSSWDFDDDNWYNGTNIGFISTVAHDFVVGDIVFIDRDEGAVDGDKNPDYNGITTIIAIPSQFRVAVEKLQGVSTQPVPGKMYKVAVIDMPEVGDVYFKYRTSPNFDRMVEDYNMSEVYTSFAWDQGRPNRIDNEVKEIMRPATIRNGQKRIPDIGINAISQFFEGDFADFDEQYGQIRKLYPEDRRLITFQDLKTSAILINATEFASVTGTNTIGTSDLVLGDAIYYKGEYGIGNNPESFAVYAGAKYHIDAARGVVLRLAGDGYTPISEYQMHNHFTDKFKDLLDNHSFFKAYGEYDIRFSEYVLATVGYTGTSTVTTTDTIGFGEKKNRWVSRYSFVPNFMTSNNVSLITFAGDQLFIHNSNQIHNNFYGAQFTSQVTIVSNENPSAIKFYKTLEQESTSVWPAISITNQFGQLSNLIATDFTEREGVFWANFLRDENTPNITLPLINGDELRCHSLVIQLENSETDYVRLFATSIRHQPSELTNR